MSLLITVSRLPAQLRPYRPHRWMRAIGLLSPGSSYDWSMDESL